MRKEIYLLCNFFVIIIVMILYTGCQKNRRHIMKEKFGTFNGKDVFLYTLKNNNDMAVKITNYGGILVSIFVPDKNGKLVDVLAGFDSLDDYIADDSFFGIVVGRFANRIKKGRFTLDGKEYQLTINNGENHLHGGKNHFGKKLWDARTVSDDSCVSLVLSLDSPDGEEGYPGNLHAKVTYSLFKDRNELKISFKATTDKPTIVNMTSHGYFNLSGSFDNTILNHQLMIDADYFTPTNKELIPTGELRDVTGTPMDFRKPKQIGQDIDKDYEPLKFAGGYDHNWVLNSYNGQIRKVVELYSPESGINMELLTDQPGIQFYSGNFLDGTKKGKGGVKYNFRTSLCLEPQNFPDAPNHPNFPSAVLRPGETYTHTTIFKFSVK
ncbi:MAG: galactose mutarotase [Candidatus Marinimicrobia bacterium]|nr:galactose mutarotase [Candidatus Neomarinimicrobiota bacterium]